MLSQNLIKRLTWDATYPAPYESIWAIIAKTIVLNNLTLHTLISLIGRKDLPRRTVRSLSCLEIEWIDFEVFAALLGVDVERLTQGTWEKLGVTPRLQGPYAIRYCPECWRTGYHCVLFDIEMFLTCPWHGCQLTPHCSRCLHPGTFLVRNCGKLINRRFCSYCHVELPNVRRLIEVAGQSAIERSVIEKSFESFLAWWGSIRTQLDKEEFLLSKLFWIGDDPQELAKYRSLQLGHGIQLAGNLDSAWKISVEPEPAHHSILLATWPHQDRRDQIYSKVTARIKDPIGHCYRSLRRHIYNTYVRRHSRCYRKLKGAGHAKCLALDSDALCRPSLAFLIWRMSIEGMSQTEAFRFRRKDNFSLRLMGPRPFLELPMEISIRWCYFSFFGIWRQIEKYRHMMKRDFAVVVSNDMCDGYVHFECTGMATTGSDNVEGPLQATLAVLYPNMASDILTCSSDCRNREARGGSMFDGPRSQALHYWRILDENYYSRHSLFIARSKKDPQTLGGLGYMAV